jgi:hypothetical protein
MNDIMANDYDSVSSGVMTSFVMDFEDNDSQLFLSHDSDESTLQHLVELPQDVNDVNIVSC